MLPELTTNTLFPKGTSPKIAFANAQTPEGAFVNSLPSATHYRTYVLLRPITDKHMHMILGYLPAHYC